MHTPSPTNDPQTFPRALTHTRTYFPTCAWPTPPCPQLLPGGRVFLGGDVRELRPFLVALVVVPLLQQLQPQYPTPAPPADVPTRTHARTCPRTRARTRTHNFRRAHGPPRPQLFPATVMLTASARLLATGSGPPGGGAPPQRPYVLPCVAQLHGPFNHVPQASARICCVYSLV